MLTVEQTPPGHVTCWWPSLPRSPALDRRGRQHHATLPASTALPASSRASPRPGVTRPKKHHPQVSPHSSEHVPDPCAHCPRWPVHACTHTRAHTHTGHRLATMSLPRAHCPWWPVHACTHTRVHTHKHTHRTQAGHEPPTCPLPPVASARLHTHTCTRTHTRAHTAQDTGWP